MTSSELRCSFLGFFEQHGHRVVASAPLVPGDDPTLLFTNAGMNQFKDVFLGRDKRDYRRAATSQKCMRVSGKHNDLENVGPSLRHHTFFEMLGNFSFGDYFKDEAIGLAWALLTDVWKLPADRLFATVFAGEGGVPRDDEAYGHWLRVLPASRIAELGAADNFWSMGETGPCGRCSEIHYFRGDHLPCPEPVCRGVECSCDRYVEVWNNVFMEFDRQPDGSLLPAARSVDRYGDGARAHHGDHAGHAVELRHGPVPAAAGDDQRARRPPIRRHDGAGGRVGPGHRRPRPRDDVPHRGRRGAVERVARVRAAQDHAARDAPRQPPRASPSRSCAGWWTCSSPRWATRTRNCGPGTTTCRRSSSREEVRFEAVLTNGLPRLEELLDQSAAAGVLRGEDAFRLYDSYGLPKDFIEDTASQRGIRVDSEGYERAMTAQKERARAKSGFDRTHQAEFFSPSDRTRRALEMAGDQFEGYTTTRVAGAPVVALFDGAGKDVEELAAGESGYAALARTPFYVESGGQVSDTGRFASESGGLAAAVPGVSKVTGWPRLHQVQVEQGRLKVGDPVTAEVNDDLRDATRRNHTATHLLHAALRKVLGPQVKQAGSLVSPERLRFDFVHHAPLTRGEIDEVERLVTAEVCRNTPVQTELRSQQEAVAAGAMALFGEKYGDTVRVVSVPGFSMELCGGTHCRATGDIGPFVIVQEGGVAASVRRIEALTGLGALRHLQGQHAALAAVLARLNVEPRAGWRRHRPAPGRGQAPRPRDHPGQDEGSRRDGVRHGRAGRRSATCAS